MGIPRPVDRRKPYVRIADELRRDIATGRYPVGEPLPAASELVDRFEHSKMTISNAIAILRDEGLVATKQGSRSTVIAKPEDVGEPPEERSEEFELIAEQLQEMRAAIRRLGSRLDDLDERTKGLDES